MSNQLTRGDGRDLLRSIGGLLFAVGALALDIRKSGSWGPGGKMLVVLIPAVILYVLALGTFDRRDPAAPQLVQAAAWQSVLMVFAVILNAIWLAQFFHWVDAHGALVTTVVFALTAASAAYGAWAARVRYAALLAALSLLIAWLAVWDKILDHPSGNTNRWLLLIVALIFLGAAVALGRRGRRESGEVVTVAGLAGVFAASLGVFLGVFALAASRISAVGGMPASLSGFNARQHFIWDLLLLVISVGLIVWGARTRVRGPGYVGALGLLIFLYSVGYQLTARLSGNPASGSIVGWPLALLLIGAIVVALGFWGDRVMAGSTATPAGARPPGAPPPDAVPPGAPPADSAPPGAPPAD